MSYYWKNILNRRDSVQSIIRSTFRAAIKYQWTQDKLCKERESIWTSYLSDMPVWIKREMTGYWEALLDVQHGEVIQFAYKHKGKLYSAKGITWPHYEESGVPINKIHKLKSGFFYKVNGKPYFDK